MNVVEEWRDIPGYEGLYQVSSLGNVKSLNYGRMGKEKVLSPRKDTDGYLFVTLYKNGAKLFKVHRLVAQAFIPNPDNKPCVDHINGNRSDNRVENLRWCTNKENMNFPLARINISKAKINNPKNSKPVQQIDINTGKVIKEYPSIKEAQRQCRIDNSQISGCCKGKLHYNTAGGYVWKYK